MEYYDGKDARIKPRTKPKQRDANTTLTANLDRQGGLLNRLLGCTSINSNRGAFREWFILNFKKEFHPSG